MSDRLAIFRGSEIRKVIYNGEWWFVVNDVIRALTDSVDPAQYFKKIKLRDGELRNLMNKDQKKGVVQIVPPLFLGIDSVGGKQKMYCWNTEGIFRLIQSIPSPKAEPFKKWLAKVGYERVQEIEDPELAMKRTRALYKAKGYTDNWIEKRMRGIAIREELTKEWSQRGLKEQKEYSILTAEICEATFGMKPGEYKAFKKLKRENLRDHMTDLELIFSMLGESATTEITQVKDSQGFVKLKKDAQDGGEIAGDARRALELKTGKRVSKKGNYLKGIEGRAIIGD